MSKPATAATQPHAVVELVPLDKIAEDPGNPRRTFTGLEELAESVKAHGVLQPIVVRPMPGIGSNLLMVVFGARRYRAAKLAGLDAIPAIRREMSDAQALEEQLVENLNRPDVHPLEEAEGYERLLHSAERKYSVEDIAAKVGKSDTYVRGRMALLKLCKEARDLFYAGRFTASSALYIARVPDHDLQRQALKMLEDWYGRDEDGRAYSLAEVSRVVRDHCLLRLADAPFPKDDATLAGAVACAVCPKRSGAQPELFADVAKKEELCTDPACFEKKKAAWTERVLKDAKAKGRKVVPLKDAKKLFSHGSLQGSEFVDLARENYSDPKYRTWKQLIGKVAKDATVVAVDDEGAVHELVPAKETKKLLKAAGHNFKSSSSGGPSRTRTSPADTAKAKEAREVEDEVQRRFYRRLLEVCRKPSNELGIWRLAAQNAAGINDAGVADDCFPGPEGEDYQKKSKRITKEIDALDDVKELRALVLALNVGEDLRYGARRAELLRVSGIDPKALEAEVKAERAAAAPAKPDEKPAPKKAPAKKGKVSRG